jgi:hypothetical protein
MPHQAHRALCRRCRLVPPTAIQMDEPATVNTVLDEFLAAID